MARASASSSSSRSTTTRSAPRRRASVQPKGARYPRRATTARGGGVAGPRAATASSASVGGAAATRPESGAVCSRRHRSFSSASCAVTWGRASVPATGGMTSTERARDADQAISVAGPATGTTTRSTSTRAASVSSSIPARMARPFPPRAGASGVTSTTFPGLALIRLRPASPRLTDPAP